MKDLGELQFFLGIHVTRDRARRRITIDQAAYVDSILERFNLQECKGATTPMVQGVKLAKTSITDKLADPVVYQQQIGCTMYAMLCTRPDIAYAVSQLSQFGSNPSETHQRALIRLLQYLQSTKDFSITYGKDYGDEFTLQGFSDADYGSTEDRKSVSAYLYILYGGTISWMAKKQSTVALSTTEAEYIALTQATKESIWIQRTLLELGRNTKDGNVIHEDNQGAIALAHNPEFHARTKHIDIQYHFVRNCVQDGRIQLRYCPTMNMVADQLTKPLAPAKHAILVARMGVGRIDQTLRHHDLVTSGSVEIASSRA